MKEIKLTQGKVAIVDDEDYEELSKHRWYYGNGYAVRHATRESKKQPKIYMHIIIMGTESGLELDHISGDALDNRRENLRHVTHQQNLHNKAPNKRGSSQYKGVHWQKDRKRWHSCIMMDGKSVNLGRYKSEQDAAMAYNEAATKYFGEYARLNTI